MLYDNPNVFDQMQIGVGAHQFSVSQLVDRELIIERCGDPDGPEIFIAVTVSVGAVFLLDPTLAIHAPDGNKYAYRYFRSIEQAAIWLDIHVQPELLRADFKPHLADSVANPVKAA